MNSFWYMLFGIFVTFLIGYWIGYTVARHVIANVVYLKLSKAASILKPAITPDTDYCKGVKRCLDALLAEFGLKLQL